MEKFRTVSRFANTPRGDREEMMKAVAAYNEKTFNQLPRTEIKTKEKDMTPETIINNNSQKLHDMQNRLNLGAGATVAKKITRNEILEMRQLWNSGTTQEDIAKHFNRLGYVSLRGHALTQATVSVFIKGNTRPNRKAKPAVSLSLKSRMDKVSEKIMLGLIESPNGLTRSQICEDIMSNNFKRVNQDEIYQKLLLRGFITASKSGAATVYKATDKARVHFGYGQTKKTVNFVPWIAGVAVAGVIIALVTLS